MRNTPLCESVCSMCSSCCGSSTLSLLTLIFYINSSTLLFFPAFQFPISLIQPPPPFQTNSNEAFHSTPPLFFSARYIPFPKPSFFLFLVFVFVDPTLTTAILIPDLGFFLFHFLVDSNSCLYFNSNNLDYSTFSRLRAKMLCFVC